MFVDEEETLIASGWFLSDTTPELDGEENEYYSNELVFFGKGWTVKKNGDKYKTSGSGDLLAVAIYSESQELQTGTYILKAEGNPQPSDSWHGEYRTNANKASEAAYDLISGTLTISESAGIYTISFTGTANLWTDEIESPDVEVFAEFKGKIKKARLKL